MVQQYMAVYQDTNLQQYRDIQPYQGDSKDGISPLPIRTIVQERANKTDEQVQQILGNVPDYWATRRW